MAWIDWITPFEHRVPGKMAWKQQIYRPSDLLALGWVQALVPGLWPALGAHGVCPDDAHRREIYRLARGLPLPVCLERADRSSPLFDNFIGALIQATSERGPHQYPVRLRDLPPVVRVGGKELTLMDFWNEAQGAGPLPRALTQAEAEAALLPWQVPLLLAHGSPQARAWAFEQLQHLR